MTDFENRIDAMVEFSEFDTELADGIRWLDMEARKKGISFYDMAYEVLLRHYVNQKAKKWLDVK